MGGCFSGSAHYPTSAAGKPGRGARRRGKGRAGSRGRHRRTGSTAHGQPAAALPGRAADGRPQLTIPSGATLDDDFHSCRDEFSIAGSPCHSTTGSPPGVNGHGNGRQPEEVEGASGSGSGSGSEDSQVEENGKSQTQPGCLNLMEVLSHRRTPASPGAEGPPSFHRILTTSNTKPNCGVSLSRRDPNMPEESASMCYENGCGQHYQIRGIDYMKTKTKVSSDESIYQLVAADMFTFDKKQNDISKLVNLPAVPAPRHKLSPTSDLYYPELLVINIQLPTYAPSLFGGATDGPGWSIVFYLKLPDDFNPATFPNQKALGLYQRLILDGKEADGSNTRDRLKIIPRVVNVGEWAESGPLSTAEHKLLSNYNEKPVLSRPQHRFAYEDHIFEIDIDIHKYSYLARSALQSFKDRLGGVVFEIAYVIQGNSQDELPEQVLACGRVYRAEFGKPAPFTRFLPHQAHEAGAVANGG